MKKKLIQMLRAIKRFYNRWKWRISLRLKPYRPEIRIIKLSSDRKADFLLQPLFKQTSLPTMVRSTHSKENMKIVTITISSDIPNAGKTFIAKVLFNRLIKLGIKNVTAHNTEMLIHNFISSSEDEDFLAAQAAALAEKDVHFVIEEKHKRPSPIDELLRELDVATVPEALTKIQTLIEKQNA